VDIEPETHHSIVVPTVRPSHMAAALQTVTLDIRRGARGRPKAPWRSVPDVASFVYLVRISKKYEIETFKFLKCIHDAWVKAGSSCNGVSVRRREITEDTATFLITTRDHQIIAQVRLTSRLLAYMVRPELFTLRFEDSSATKWKASQTEDLEIKDLNSETKRFNLNAKVTEKSSPRTILSRWGNTLLLSTATITDRSGTIKLPLWKDQISRISVGDRIHLENARLKRFRGEFQVRVDRLTRLSIIENQQSKKQLTAKPDGT
jgi:replication factor A1